MSVPEACIFDLDGVIVETAEFHFKAWKRLADQLDIPFDREDNEALKGVSRRESLNIILELGGQTLPEKEIRELMDRKNQWYNEYLTTLTSDDILPGIPVFIDTLRELGVKLAIGSSSKNARTIMDYLQINDLFDAVIDGTKIVNTKPDPEVFLKAAGALEAEPGRTIVFEDATAGIEAANAAGMYSVGVGKKENLPGADLVISTFEGLTPARLFSRLNI
ncbi:MAG: beta-phosphoglucomutase [Balneolaceae bacterium]|nr:beta-phosphoglucomutase [Balneolaceae bacterium]